MAANQPRVHQRLPIHQADLDTSGLTAVYVQALMQGQAPNGATPDSFGDRRELIHNLHKVYAVHGTAGVQQFMQGYLARHPEEMWLTSATIQAPERKVRWTANELLDHDFPPTVQSGSQHPLH
jgi:hypothetical protein